MADSESNFLLSYCTSLTIYTNKKIYICMYTIGEIGDYALKFSSVRVYCSCLGRPKYSLCTSIGYILYQQSECT